MASTKCRGREQAAARNVVIRRGIAFATCPVMLRIHKESDGQGRVVLRLEGSLLFPWVPELVSVLETIAREALVVDLASLAYADKQGERLLRDLVSRAELRGCSPFLAELLRGSQKP